MDPEAWSSDRDRCRAFIQGMDIHDRHLRRYPVRLLWTDDFFLGFPWNQPSCPTALFDACVAINRLYEFLRGQRRLLTPDQIGPAPGAAPTIQPDLLDDEYGYPDELCSAWRTLLGAAARNSALVNAGIAIPSWPRALLGGSREIQITNAESCALLLGRVPLLLSDADWRAFLDCHHRTDLRGRRVAVLGGSRAPFERARQQLESYGLEHCRRLPPAYEKHRTAQDTKDRLRTADLVIVCTNRLLHTDTDQLKSVRGDLACAVVELSSDGETQLVKAVIDHFRALDEQGAAPSAGEGAS
ncbi:MAG TPA: hypothetical protein VLS89_03365 [Candidatus Nanopelagicales bacterium]|nr:hypothetical protein [Candidatus Nanopelagicales bacterium]